VNDLSHSRAVLTKSGTITLELAVMGIPQVVAHRVHPITYGLGRQLIQGIRHIAMPNILAGKEVVPEFIQTLDPVVLADAIMGLPETQEVDLSALGAPGAIDRTANHVWNWMGAA
jgi:lipid-A-disaccharide synthase